MEGLSGTPPPNSLKKCSTRMFFVEDILINLKFKCSQRLLDRKFQHSPNLEIMHDHSLDRDVLTTPPAAEYF
jgi:hypothetical protein